jgi:hypothetical protein
MRQGKEDETPEDPQKIEVLIRILSALEDDEREALRRFYLNGQAEAVP